MNIKLDLRFKNINKTSCLKERKIIRKDLEEFDAMVYEEGKLYERVLLQVKTMINSN